MISGRYALHGEIASGGMATVCFGRMVGAAGFSRTVAIKRLHPHLAKDPEFAAMFLDEARLAARVRHPGVVCTLDVVSEGDELFLVMEYVPGESLSALLRSTMGAPPPSPRAGAAPVPPPVAASIVAGALHGLHAAHEARGEDGRPLEIVHRDVSPQNILVGEDGVARLIDFGIARAAVRSQATREGQLKGKLRYMAPEQLQGAPATRRADVYATAVVLWEALTGARLFDGESEGAIYGRILEGVVRPPSAFAAVPAALDAVVLRGLARDPAARFGTALEMAEALEGAIAPAPLREVAAWVQRLGGPVLAQRAARVREIEEGATERGDEREPGASDGSGEGRAEGTLTAERPVAMGDAPRPPALAPGGMLDAPATAMLTVPVSLTNRPPAGRPRARWAALAAASALGLVVVMGLGARATERAAAPEARRGIAAAALIASLRARSAAAAAPAASGGEAPAPATDPAPAPLARKAAPAVSARARSACDPPYSVDATGIRRVKRECL